MTYLLDDVMTLINFCSTDVQSRNLCHSPEFWKFQFDRLNLPLDDNIYFTNAHDWIQYLLKTNDIVNKIKLLKNGETVTFDVHMSVVDLYNLIDVPNMNYKPERIVTKIVVGPNPIGGYWIHYYVDNNTIFLPLANAYSLFEIQEFLFNLLPLY
jgi:hypothetical protein